MMTAFAALCGASPPAYAAPPIHVEKQRPSDFVDIKSVATSIQVDIRYSGYHNFIGHPVPGYEANKCLLTHRAANAIAGVQRELVSYGLSLRLYDCYRPQRAVAYFVRWAGGASDAAMKQEFYPREDKAKLLPDGYVASPSSHSRGSTVDLTIIPLLSRQVPYSPGQALKPCIKPIGIRFADGALDMGTGYDCFDVMATDRAPLTPQQKANRLLLKTLMMQAGFQPYQPEWWHFTLKSEPYHDVYFDFPVK
jgi:D-alanyl-D-alanine dipeptidase